MKFSQLFSTIIKWCRSFFHTKSVANYWVPTYFLSPDLQSTMFMACEECIQTSPRPGFHLVDSVVSSQTYWLCPHALIKAGKSVKDSSRLPDGSWSPSMSPKSKSD